MIFFKLKGQHSFLFKDEPWNHEMNHGVRLVDIVLVTVLGI
jgi:hypothetical protein